MTRRPQIVVTRPRSDAERLARPLAERGFKVLYAPLLDVTHLPLAARDFSAADAIAITSRNALSALAADADVLRVTRRLPLYAVGRATAERARALGFRQVIEGPGNAAGLADRIQRAAMSGELRSAAPPGKVRVIHPSTAHKAFDLAAALLPHDIETIERDAYVVSPAEALPDEVSAALRSGQLNAVTLMSPRTAEVWSRLASEVMRGSPPGGALASLPHVCLSEAVAAALQPLSLTSGAIWVSPHMDIESIVLTVRRVVERGEAE